MTIQITYRRTSRLSIRIVKNGDVHVSAPIGLPRKKVEAFIEQHSDWIVKARRKTVERQKQQADFFNQLPLTTKAEKVDAMKRVRELVQPMVEQYAKVMDVCPSSVNYKPMISRWGM